MSTGEIISNIRTSIINGTSRYAEGAEPFGGMGIIVCAEGEAPERKEGYIVIETSEWALVSAVFYEIRDGFRSVMDLTLKDQIYPRVALAARKACADAASAWPRSSIVDAMLEALYSVLHEPSRRYFAYGSNMDTKQMAHRCPDAKPAGTATLSGWSLWMDQAGYATIAEGEGSAEGALWDISLADELELDRYEGVATGCYEKRCVAVESEEGESEALVYISLRTPVVAETWQGRYLERCITAAKKLGLQNAYKRLEKIDLIG